MNKKNQITTVASEASLMELRSQFPVESGFERTFLPRLSFKSQDVVEGKGKTMKVITEAGTFIEERQTDEKDENDKQVWTKEELGLEIEGTIIFYRKQLKYFDEKNEVFTSSTVYDNEDETVVLFCNKAEVDRGTPKELKDRPEYAYEKDGKKKSKLEENRILYVLKDEEVFQLNLRGSSMYSFMTYTKKNFVPAELTKFSSTAESKGSIDWNKMAFEKVRDLNAEEVALVMEKVNEIKKAIKAEKDYFASINAGTVEANEELKKF